MSEGSPSAPEPGAESGSGSSGGRVPEQPGPTPPEPARPASPEGGTPPELRIGHEERAAALAALDEHFEKGRLDVNEYGDRSAVAGSAVVASELADLFRDLPAPHPDLPGRSPATTSSSEPNAAVAHRPGGPPARRWADTLRVALPLLALAGIVTLVAFGHGAAFAFFPFIFILAHRFGPGRSR